MARTYSAVYKSTLAKTSAEEAPLILLKIYHPAIPGTDHAVYIINDTLDLTSNGILYIACAFKCELPSDEDGQMARARLSIDNVGRALMTWIEASAGGFGSIVTFSQVMRSRPDVVEWSITMNLYNVVCTSIEVSADLGFNNFFNKPSTQVTFRPETAPGIF